MDGEEWVGIWIVVAAAEMFVVTEVVAAAAIAEDDESVIWILSDCVELNKDSSQFNMDELS